MMDRLTKVPFRDNLTTDGSGLYSDRVVTVPVTHLQVPYANKERTFGELCVYFNDSVWDVDRLGLIYTDRGWLRELKDALVEAGFDASGIDYSEQGMQGENYVSLDVDGRFLSSWFDVVSTVEI